MITQVTYERLFNLGNYESERISATATVESADIEGAYDEARTAVETEHNRNALVRAGLAPAEYIPPASYEAPPASEAQRKFIATLQDKIGWSSEQFAVYAGEQGYYIDRLTKSDASALIDGMQKLAREEGIVGWAQRVVTPAEKPGTVGSVGIPF